jgi:DNA-binding NtrC family response regulator
MAFFWKRFAERRVFSLLVTVVAELQGAFMLHSHESFSQEKTRSLNLILVVTTDVQVGSFLQQMINRETRHRVLLAFHERQALRVVEEVKPDLFLLDYELVEKSGFQLYERLHAARGCADIPAFLSPLKRRFARYVKHPSLEVRELSSELDRFLSTLEELLV